MIPSLREVKLWISYLATKAYLEPPLRIVILFNESYDFPLLSQIKHWS